MAAKLVAGPYWTPRAVATLLEEAADTLGRLPDDRGGGYARVWPPTVHGSREPLGSHAVARPIPPSPEAIDRMEEVLGWLCWLEPEERRLVWLRAEGLPWKRITCRLGIGRTTAWQKWTMALLKIASRLNTIAEQERPNNKLLNKSRRIVLQTR
jgi:hypothetical protein